MKIMDDLRNMATPDLIKMAGDLAFELARFRSAKFGIGCSNLPSRGQGKTSWGLVTKIKKDRARILTVLGERGVKI